jgi:hypothetical protein
VMLWHSSREVTGAMTTAMAMASTMAMAMRPRKRTTPKYPEGALGVEPILAAQGFKVLDIPVGGHQN